MTKLTYTLRFTFFSAIFIFFIQNVTAQTGTISGYVKDANGQPLSGASIQVQSSKKTTIADNNGMYSLTTNAGKQTIIVSYAGFVAQSFNVTVTENATTKQDVALNPSGELFNVKL